MAAFELSARTISLLKKGRKKARTERTKRQINKKRRWDHEEGERKITD